MVKVRSKKALGTSIGSPPFILLFSSHLPKSSYHVTEIAPKLTFYKVSSAAEKFVLAFVFQDTEKVNFSYNKLADPKFSFYDKTLVDAVKRGDPWVHLFFRSLALCHTVMAEEKVQGEKGPEASRTENMS